MFGITELKLPPKIISLLNAVVAQAWGVILETVCIHCGVMYNGHQQPPSGASIKDASTPIDDALRSVFTNVASITPKAEAISTISTDTNITVSGENPRSTL